MGDGGQAVRTILTGLSFVVAEGAVECCEHS